MMKASIKLFFGITIIILFGCEDRINQTRVYKANVPVYMTIDELRTPREMEEPKPVLKMGKLYFKDGQLFIGEKNKGVHIFDNTDPANPKNIGYIDIPGNSDIAIKNDMLYANSCVDLVVLDISNIQEVKETDRIENIFEYYFPEYDASYPVQGWNDSERVIIDFNLVEIEEEIEYNNRVEYGPGFIAMEDGAFDMMASPKEINASYNPTGTGGSMARFLIYQDYLYTVMNWKLQPFNIVDLSNPVVENEIYLNNDVETIFRRKDKLLLGSTSGMMIYDLDENPAQPSFISELAHVRSCDPVVVEGNYAFVTLRSGTICQGFTNQLDIIDISDLSKPELITSYPMTNPHGLGIDDGILFICDGNDGLKIYDANDIMTIDDNLLYHFKDIHAFDVIPLGKVLVMIGEDGVYQYDYSDISNLKLLSSIQIGD